MNDKEVEFFKEGIEKNYSELRESSSNEEGAWKKIEINKNNMEFWINLEGSRFDKHIPIIRIDWNCTGNRHNSSLKKKMLSTYEDISLDQIEKAFNENRLAWDLKLSQYSVKET